MLDRFGLALAAVVLSAGCSDAPQPTPVSPSPADPPAPTPDSTAHYRVTFDATWSLATHPNMFPGDPHFSGLIGATHLPGFRLWREDAVASGGIEAMAERGAKSPLDDEIERAIQNTRAEHLLSGGVIARSPGAVSLDFDISLDQPSVTLVSMLAPSPDWFVGVSGLSLLVDGDWVQELTIDLEVYDAGTDSGSTFTARDRETVPREPIAHITTPPLARNGIAPPVGTFTFRRR